MSNEVETASLPGGGVCALPLSGGFEALRSRWGWFFALGIALIVVGTMAIGSSFFATLATVIAFGTLLLIAGGMQIVGAFSTRKWSGFFVELLTGIFYLVLGMLTLAHPLGAAAGITLMIAAFLLVGGMLRIVVAVAERFESWGWVLLNGAVAVLLGIFIWRQWPLTGLWVIGLFVGIEMVFCGWSWVMLALAARRLPRQEDA